ncbi:hypothetical protein ACVR05_08640 [Streptococcus caprae]|uniref:Uncharacterized protein n=1 Tax=Streptococcus caprae TaxID=1640501 RepID=A0ABV8CTP8_9STRE
MEFNWVTIVAIVAIWLFLLYEAYALQQRKVAGLLSNQDVVADLAREMLAGKDQKQILAYMKKQYKISGMAAMAVYSQIKMVLDQRSRQDQEK